MQKSPLLKNILWLSTLAAILIFYIVVNNSVNSLLERNKVLEDSLIILQNELNVLDSLLITVPVDASFNDTILSQSGNTVTIKFSPLISSAENYNWDFGDGNSSSDAFSVHKYNVTKTREYNVTLSFEYNGQSYTKTRIIMLRSSSDTGKIDASFDTVTVSRSQNSITMKFTPRTKKIDSCLWNFGSGQTSMQKESRQTFVLDKSLRYTVKLKIYYGGNSAETKRQIVFKKESEIKVTIRLKKNNFLRCDSTLYKFELNPQGGVVTGEGVEKINGVYCFIPARANVKKGKIIFKYKAAKDSASYTVNLNDIDASYNIISDTSKGRDNIIIKCVPKNKNYDSYTWEVNNKKVSDEKIYILPPELVNRHFNQKTKIKIRLTVSKDGCTAKVEKEY